MSGETLVEVLASHDLVPYSNDAGVLRPACRCGWVHDEDWSPFGVFPHKRHLAEVVAEWLEQPEQIEAVARDAARSNSALLPLGERVSWQRFAHEAKKAAAALADRARGGA